MKKHFFALSVALLMVCGFCCGAVEGTVSASMLNARVFPELKSPAAVKLPRGKKVEIFSRHGLWLEIAAPDITPVYTSAAYLSGNMVIRDVNLRIRPHAKAAVIGRVQKGTQLKAVSEPDRFGWVQVAPLADMRLYVMRDYVIHDAAKVPVAKQSGALPGQKAAPAPEKKAEAVKKEIPAPAPVKKAEVAKKEIPAPAPEKKAETVKKAAPAPEKKAEAVKKEIPAPAPEKKAEAVKKEIPAPAPAPEKKAEAVKKEIPAPAPVKKAEAVKKEIPAPAPAPAPEKKAETVKKAAPAFELLPQRKRELINIGTDITKNTRFEKTGRLVAVLNPNGSCTTFALVGISDSRSMGFIFAEAPIELKKYVEKVIEVKGYAYKVSGWRNPVVCATEVKAIGE